jgi:uncharacterized protein YqeY
VSLKETISNDIKTALLGGDRFRGEILKNFKAAILNEEVAKNKRDEGLGDEEIEQLLAREIKKRNESAELFKAAGRQELADNELQEREVLSTYMPAQLTDDEIKNVVIEVISGLENPNMGQVIGAVKAKLGNSADGGTVARIVKESL